MLMNGFSIGFLFINAAVVPNCAYRALSSLDGLSHLHMAVHVSHLTHRL